MRGLSSRLATVTMVAGVFAASALLLQAQGSGPTIRSVPADLDDTAWLDARRDAQLGAAGRLEAFHDFRFVDRLADSGITFRSGVVDDAARYYKAVHYDHGFGLAVADVDGDGRPDLYFVNQVGGSQLWRNTGQGRFRDVTADAGVGVADRAGVAASFADIDNDNDADLFVTTVRGGNLLFENDGKGRFRDITSAAGVGYVGHSSTGVFFDYDRDGLLDLFLVNVGRYTSDAVGGSGYRYFVGFWDAFSSHLMPERAERSILYRNMGGNRFVDVTGQVGLTDTSWSGDATPIDVNADGWLDLYVLNMQGDDEYYENAGGARFVRRSRDVFPRTSWGAMGVKVFDANGDGRLDLFTTDMHSDMSANVGPGHEHMKSHITWPESFRGNGSTSIWGNALFLNEGSGRFREASDDFGVENYWPWGPSVGDLNADGFDDLFITAGMNYPFRYGANALKLNDRGRRFHDAEFILGVEPRTGGVSTPWFELDASSAPDRGHEAAQGASGRVIVRGAKGSRSAAMVDLDADGDLDIVTNEFNGPPMVLVSDLSAKRRVNYLSVVLAGTTSNRSGLGAVVTVVTPGGRSTKVMDGRSGYLAQSLQPLYFGLGDSRVVERVEVAWPSGQRQVVTRGIEPNGVLTITEP